MTLLELHEEFTDKENRIIFKHIRLMVDNNLTVKQATENAMKEIERLK